MIAIAMITATKPFVPPLEDYNEYIKQIFENRWFTNHGPFVTAFENHMRSFIGSDQLLVVSNGTIALQIALKALGISGEVLTTPFSYVATTSSVLWENCTPRFVDIHPSNFNIDPTKIEASITPKTEAILATNVYGIPCDFEAIQTIADKHGLKIIYDNAHGFSTKVGAVDSSTFGDISTISFHATKLFHSIEGGAIICKDQAVFEKVKLMRNFGHTSPSSFGDVGINGKMNEMCAAMGLVNIPFLPEILSTRKRQWLYYANQLKDSKYQLFDYSPIEAGYNYAYFPLVFETEQELLEKMEVMEQHQISVRRYFYPSLNELDFLKVHDDCPVSESISRRVICLPLYHDLTVEEQNLILSFLL